MTMNIPFINSRNTDPETETPWADLLAEQVREDVANLRRIADEIDDDHGEELRAIADDYELMAEYYESK